MGNEHDVPYPESPGHLTPRAAALWRGLGPNHASTVGRRALLQAALEAMDRAEGARQAIAVDGMVTKTGASGAIHLNPLVKAERDARQQFVAIWRALRLDCGPAYSEPAKDPEPDTPLDEYLRELAANTDEFLPRLSQPAAVPPKRKRTRKEKVNA